jgi:hypothetical protein
VDGAQRGQAYLLTDINPKGLRVAVVLVENNKTVVKGPIVVPRTQGLKLEAVMWGAVTSSSYVFGIIQEQEADSTEPAPIHFIDMDLNLNIVSRSRLDSKTVRVPFNVRWLKLKQGQYRPAWIGAGLEPDKNPDLWDRWEKRNTQERVQQRLYWLDETFKPKTLSDVQGLKFVDFVPGPQDSQGVLTALVVKSQGPSSQPSYVQDVSFVTFAEGQVTDVLKTNDSLYRSLLEARRGPLYNLDSTLPFARGLFWFAEGAIQAQKITTWDLIEKKFQHYDARPLRRYFDVAIGTRAVFEGQKMSGAFVMTNSEIQYHDIRTGQAARKSLEAYSFFSDSLRVLLAYPLVIKSQRQNISRYLPALFASENVDFERGIKLVVPYFAKNGELAELISPAKLNIKADKKCKPFKTPIQLESGETALDFFCSDEAANSLVRVFLSY